MIKCDIRDDARISAESGIKSLVTVFYNGVCVGVLIDCTMEPDASLYVRAKAIFQTPFYVIAEKATNQQAGFRTRQSKMCQVVQLSPVSGSYSRAIFCRYLSNGRVSDASMIAWSSMDFFASASYFSFSSGVKGCDLK